MKLKDTSIAIQYFFEYQKDKFGNEIKTGEFFFFYKKGVFPYIPR